MTAIIEKIKSLLKNKHFFKYVIVGVLTQLVDLGTYALLVQFGVFYVVADFINNPLVIGFNYLMHKYYTFDVKKWTKAEVGRYALNVLFVYLYTTAFLVFFVSILGLNEVVGKVLTIVVTTFINFNTLKRFVFKSKAPPTNEIPNSI